MALTAVKVVPSNQPVREYSLYINGEWAVAADGAVADDFNPATGALYARVAQAGRADALRAVESAYAARAAWARVVVSDRAEILLRAADILATKVDEIREVLIEESGSTFGKSMFEVFYCIDLLRSAAGDARHIFGETLPHSMPGQIGMTLRQPLGVIAGIAPFNAPFLLAMKKVVLALAAGNCFVLKPSDETPVSGLKIAEIFHAAKLPPGVLNVVIGPANTVGEVLLTDPRVRMITFTGSTKVGKLIAVEAAKSLKNALWSSAARIRYWYCATPTSTTPCAPAASEFSSIRARSAWLIRALLLRRRFTKSSARSLRRAPKLTRLAIPTIRIRLSVHSSAAVNAALSTVRFKRPSPKARNF